MKITKALILSLMSMLILVGCSSKDDYNPNPNGGNNEPNHENNEEINRWIHKEMDLRYYWSDKIPPLSSLDFSIKPQDFFESLLYNKNIQDGDRFSYMDREEVVTSDGVKANLNGVNATDIGFEYYVISTQNVNSYVYCVVYVKPNTDAEAKGLKRGDIIEEVGGQKINNENRFELLHSAKGFYELTIVDGRIIKFNTTKNYAENPIFYSDVIRYKTKDVGYVMYNFFTNGKDDKSNDYAIALNKIMKEFQTNNIDDLILDLRYNPGGLVQSGTYLASAIVPNRTEDMIYTTRTYNEKYAQYLRKEYRDQYWSLINNPFYNKIESTREDIARLEMPRLYVITSRYTASASEQIINGLRPYLNVIIIGEETVGKNLESQTIKDDENKNNPWVLQPITSKSFNSKGESNYANGFAPDVELDEFPAFLSQGSLAPIGDVKEILLSAALKHIAGERVTSRRNVGVSQIRGASIERKRNNMVVKQNERRLENLN